MDLPELVRVLADRARAAEGVRDAVLAVVLLCLSEYLTDVGASPERGNEGAQVVDGAVLAAGVGPVAGLGAVGAEENVETGAHV